MHGPDPRGAPVSNPRSGGRRLAGWLTALSVVALVALAGVGAAQEQPVIANLNADVAQAPGQLPGSYAVEVDVTVEAPGDQCLCQETTVEPGAESSTADEVRFDPESYTIVWVENWQTEEHERTVNATVVVPAVDDAGEVTFDVHMEHHPGAATTSQTESHTIELPTPETEDTQATPASTSQETGDEEEPDGVPAPPLAAGLAALFATAIAARGREW